MERARTSTLRRDPEKALELWRGLVSGEWSLVDRWESDGKSYLAAHRNRPNVIDPRALTAHESAVFEYVTLGASNKEIAFALGLPLGSVGTAVSQLLRKLGCRRRGDLVSYVRPSDRARVGTVEADGTEVDVMTTPSRGDEDVFAKLTITEREIAHRIVAGETNATIARARKTSPHTVSNQVRTIFEKVGVRSRAELVRASTR